MEILKTIPAIIYKDLTHAEKLRIARQSNNNAETLAETPFTDDAEMVWAELKQEGITQEKLAKTLGQGFTINIINRLSALEWKKWGGSYSGVHPTAWDMVKSSILPQNEEVRQTPKKNGGKENLPGGKFSEFMLRDMLSLRPAHQLKLVSELAKGEITPGKFKTSAKNNSFREDIYTYCRQQLGKVDFEFLREYCTDILNGLCEN